MKELPRGHPRVNVVEYIRKDGLKERSFRDGQVITGATLNIRVLLTLFKYVGPGPTVRKRRFAQIS